MSSSFSWSRAVFFVFSWWNPKLCSLGQNHKNSSSWAGTSPCAAVWRMLWSKRHGRAGIRRLTSKDESANQRNKLVLVVPKWGVQQTYFVYTKSEEFLVRNFIKQYWTHQNWVNRLPGRRLHILRRTSLTGLFPCGTPKVQFHWNQSMKDVGFNVGTTWYDRESQNLGLSAICKNYSNAFGVSSNSVSRNGGPQPEGIIARSWSVGLIYLWDIYGYFSQVDFPILCHLYNRIWYFKMGSEKTGYPIFVSASQLTWAALTPIDCRFVRKNPWV